MTERPAYYPANFEAEMREAGRGHLLASTPTLSDKADLDRKRFKEALPLARDAADLADFIREESLRFEARPYYMCPRHGKSDFATCNFCMGECEDWNA